VTARNHHFVPQCYLKGFARHSEKPKLFVVDLKTRKTFETHPRNIAAERDFHAVDLEGQPTDAIEAALSGFEGPLAAALGRIIADKEIRADDDKIYLLNLVALLAVKNPRLRRSYMAFQDRLYEMMGDLMTANDEIWNSQVRQAQKAGYLSKEINVSREQVRDFLTRGEYTIEVRAGYHVGLEFRVFDKVLCHFFERSWMLLRAPASSHGFITSDYPACLFWSDAKMRGGPYPPGYAMRGTEVLFPISSHLAWVGTFEHDARIIDITEEEVRHFNAAVLDICDRQAYGRHGDCGYQFDAADKPRRLRELLNDRRFGFSEGAKTKVRIARAWQR
jgi:hypothetical protein